MSCHPLMIEKGRHSRPPIERTERKCPFCKDHIEDECHFLITCPLYKDGRKVLFDEVTKTAPMFAILPTDRQKATYIFINEDDAVLSKLSEFIYNGFKKRADFLESLS